MEPYDKNISPVDWYVGSYLVRFVELESKDNENLDKKFYSWENTIIVQAKSFNEAYEKVVLFAKRDEEPYKGGKNGIPVQWVFEGVTELLPIYEPLEDGAEIMWTEHKPKKLKTLKERVKSLHELKQ